MKRFAATVGALLVAITLVHAEKKHQGNTLGEWMNIYWTWYFTGEPASGTVGQTVLLPFPNGTPSEEDPSIFVGEMSFSLRPGESFVLPMFVWIGERYEGYPEVADDDPAFPGPEIFMDLHLVVKLDGKTIISDLAGDLPDVFFDTQYFDQPLIYETPTDYGAVAALWVQGVGMIQHPMSKGNHTLQLFVYSDFFGVGYANTWHLTVEK